MASTYSDLPNKLVSAANGIDYAYREAGEGATPLVLLQHFRGNLDNWDPALIDALAATRHVVTFDAEFAADCEAFLSGQASLRAASLVLIGSRLPEAEANISGLYPV
jgi:pimeloyl-ACP methyl ester carboxylesterase